jgi:hypothetical protein
MSFDKTNQEVEKTFKQIYIDKKKEYEEYYEEQCKILLNDVRKLIIEFLNNSKMEYIDWIIETSFKHYTELFYIYHNNDNLLVYMSKGNGKMHLLKTDVPKKIIQKSKILDNLTKDFLLDIYREIFSGCSIEYDGDFFDTNIYKHYRLNIIFEE